jgi:hypothetical protein
MVNFGYSGSITFSGFKYEWFAVLDHQWIMMIVKQGLTSGIYCIS